MTAAESGAGVSPAITTFLTHLSVALHKCRAYPDGHPMRVEAAESTLRLLTAVLAERPVLRVGVARRHFLVDGEETDPSQPVLRELAERLQRRQVGGITFRSGVEAGELVAMLTRLNEDHRGKPPGGSFDGPEAVGPHVELYPLSYGRLRLATEGTESGSGETPDELWADLARLAELDGGAVGEQVPLIASAITARAIDPESAPRTSAMLQEFGRAAAEQLGPEGMAARRAMANLLRSVPRPVLMSLLDLKLEAPEGISRLLTASEWLAVPALLDLVESAAAASQQSVSHFFLRLLRKLGTRSTASPHPTSPENDAAMDRGVREAVQAILRNWTLRDPNPPEHTGLLEEITSHDQAITLPTTTVLAESRRVVRMALELDGTGQLVVDAVHRMLEAGELAELVDDLEGAADSHAAPEIWGRLVVPDVLRRILLEEPVDHAACARLLRHVPFKSAEGLLDSLTISESEETRRLIVHRLAELCPDVLPPLLERLDAAPWFLRRGLLALLADLPEAPQGFPAKRYVDESEPLVRREGIRIMLHSPADVEEAVHRALADDDERVVRVGLEHGREHGLPRTALPRLMKLLNASSRPVELRALGIGLLEQFASPAVRQWLLKRVLIRRGLFRRIALAPKSPELIAGLGVLARAFPGDPDTAELWRRVESSDDPQLRAARRMGPS
ncbi:MAG TPA: hypothetical protein VGQ17_14935 [Gemmatimonadales bacterium]|jgi:hypothetical protein|nr:hypothetical protein [Gemmatimonadales bacterium]